MESEVQRLIGIRHSNLLSVFAVRLTIPQMNAPPELVILSERWSVMTLQDLLEDCESIKEERAAVRPHRLALVIHSTVA